MNRKRYAITLVLAILLTATLSGGQSDKESLPNEVAVAARKQALMNDTTDLEQLAKSVQGSTGAEFNATMMLNEKATLGVTELDATLWFLAVYDHMQCEPDHDVAKQALTNRLGFYSHLLDLHAQAAAGDVGFARLPATVQAGVRVKDNLRAAKTTLDEILASLK